MELDQLQSIFEQLPPTGRIPVWNCPEQHFPQRRWDGCRCALRLDFAVLHKGSKVVSWKIVRQRIILAWNMFNLSSKLKMWLEKEQASQEVHQVWVPAQPYSDCTHHRLVITPAQDWLCFPHTALAIVRPGQLETIYQPTLLLLPSYLTHLSQ